MLPLVLVGWLVPFLVAVWRCRLLIHGMMEESRRAAISPRRSQIIMESFFIWNVLLIAFDNRCMDRARTHGAWSSNGFCGTQRCTMEAAIIWTSSPRDDDDMTSISAMPREVRCEVVSWATDWLKCSNSSRRAVRTVSGSWLYKHCVIRCQAEELSKVEVDWSEVRILWSWLKLRMNEVLERCSWSVWCETSVFRTRRVMAVVDFFDLLILESEASDILLLLMWG